MAKLKRIFLGGVQSYPIKPTHGWNVGAEIEPYDCNVPDVLYLMSLEDGKGVFKDNDGQLWNATFAKIDELNEKGWSVIWQMRGNEISSSGYVCLEDIFMSTYTNWSQPKFESIPVAQQRFNLLKLYHFGNYPLTESEKMIAHKNWLWKNGYITNLTRPKSTAKGVKALLMTRF